MVRAVCVLTLRGIPNIALNVVACVAHEPRPMFAVEVLAPPHALQIIHHLDNEFGVLLRQVHARQRAVLVLQAPEVLELLRAHRQVIWTGIPVDLSRLYLLSNVVLLIDKLLVTLQEPLEQAYQLALLEVDPRELEHALLCLCLVHT